MPSAQKRGFGEPLVIPNRSQPDLHSLLNANQSSRITNLNSLHPRGKVLFAEGETARGIYLLRSGRAAVSISSSEGRLVILRIAHAGEVLGLNSTLQNCSHDTTVKTLEPCRTDFIARAELIEVMTRGNLATQAIMKVLSQELTELVERTRSLLLPQTTSARLAKLLLEWTNGNGFDTSPAKIDRVLTHEELAQMICSSRETVTRMLAMLSTRQIIEINSDIILIRDRAALEAIAQG